MIIGQFEEKLYKRLESFFSKHGFELLLDKKQFRKSSKVGFQNIIFSVSEAKKEFWLEVNFGLRNHQIEQIAQQFLNNSPEYQADANTFVISIGKYNDLKYFRFKIENKDDLDETSEQIIDFFQNRGFKFLDESSKYLVIEKIFNREPHKPCKYLYNQIHRAFKGLIAARLYNSPRYQTLIETYRNYLYKAANDEEIIKYERLVNFLKFYSPN